MPHSGERGPYDTLIDSDDPIEILEAKARRRIGRVVAKRYSLHRLLGTGSAGAVFGAVDQWTGQLVALKILHEGLSRSDEHAARFAREARAASAIGHPGVVDVLETGRDEDGSLYMVLELLVGEALFYSIQDRSLSTRETLEVGVQLLDALGAAHARGIVHRDVKPENVFLCRENDDRVSIKLLDFGIAKYLCPDRQGTFSTMEGLLVGTPHYMCPEVCTGEPAEEGADLWAVGAVLYHAFAGIPPFDGAHIGQLLMRIVNDKAPSLATHRPDLPGAVIAAVDRSLAKDPADRWPDASAFAAALRNAFGVCVDALDYEDDLETVAS